MRGIPKVRGDRVQSAYLGFPLLISESGVAVCSPSGRRLGVVPSVKQARLMVRGYRHLYRTFARERHRRNYTERMADPARAARWRAQKRQWWREHRAKRPVKVLVAP